MHDGALLVTCAMSMAMRWVLLPNGRRAKALRAKGTARANPFRDLRGKGGVYRREVVDIEICISGFVWCRRYFWWRSRIGSRSAPRYNW